MRYHVLATDYDGTIAKDERVSPEVVEALKRLKASGRKLILVTGRELDQLKAIFPEHTLFDLIVAENGALIYRPDTMQERLLGEKPPEAFIQELKSKGVPVSVGRVIVATWEPHQTVVLEVIKTTGLEYQTADRPFHSKFLWRNWFEFYPAFSDFDLPGLSVSNVNQPCRYLCRQP